MPVVRCVGRQAETCQPAWMLNMSLCDPSVCPRFVDMEGWTLLSGDRQVVPHERQEPLMLSADLQRVPEAIPELY